MCESIKIAVYMRVSTKEQADSGLGLEAQKRGIEQYIYYHFQNVEVEYFVDAGITGAVFSERKELQKMLIEIQRKKFNKCIIYKVDRLSRDIEISSQIKKAIIKSKCDLISVTESFNLNTSEGNFIYNIQSVFAENERALISKRTNDAQISKLERKEYPWRIGLGYRKINNKIVIDEDEAEFVRFIFERFLEVKSYQRLLNEIVLKYNKHVTVKILHYTLTRFLYTGDVKKEEKIYFDIFPAIINKDLFEKVQQVMKSIIRAKQEENYIFSKLIYCSRCMCNSERNSGQKKKKIYYYYRCPKCKKYINVEKIELMVRYLVLLEISNDKKKLLLSQQRKYLNKLNQRKKEIRKDYLFEKISSSEFSEMMDLVDKEIKIIYSTLFVNEKINYHDFTLQEKSIFYLQHVHSIYIDFTFKTLDKIIYNKNNKK